MKRPGWPRWWRSASFWLLAALVAATGWLGWLNGLGRVDLVLGDFALEALESPGSDRIVIVAIDDASLAALGRWPWRREIHARLIERIGQAGPAAVGLDVLFSEPDAQHPEDDRRLAAALRSSGKVVLPVVMGSVDSRGVMGVQTPHPQLATAAAAVGHAHFEVDPDGLVRSVFLREGVGDRLWPQLSLAMLALSPRGQAAAEAAAVGARRPPGPWSQVGAWRRDQWVQIPFGGAPGRFRTVSYVDALDGVIPPEVFRDRFVLIGATATGMGDAWPTPVSVGRTAMPGVELLAQVLDAALQGRQLRLATPAQNLGFTLLPLLMALLGLGRLSPRAGLVLVVALVALVPVAAGLLLVFAGWRAAPLAAIVGLVLCYPLWSLRRQERALRFLAEEFDRIRVELPGLARLTPPIDPRGRDELSRRIATLRQAAAQSRAVHGLLQSSLDNLPDPVVVTDERGALVLANRAAEALGAVVGDPRGLDGVLKRVAPELRVHLPTTEMAMSEAPFALETPVEGGSDRLVKGAPRRDASNRTVGWVIALVDIAMVRQAQRRRDEALRFISHDIRAPQTSIVALVELWRTRGDHDAAQVARTLDRIESLANRSLRLADDFLQLARAEAGQYERIELDLGDLARDAADQIWPLASNREVRVELRLPAEPMFFRADPDLLTRALVNLLGNAVKFSEPGTTVVLEADRRDADWCLTVRDQGPGIDPADLPRLFKKFSRLENDASRRVGGAGLGLAFVKTVAEAHGGGVEVESTPGQGAAFRVVLPGQDVAPEAD